jgi:RNA polymerase sigma factor
LVIFSKTQTLEERVLDTRGDREKTSTLITQFKPFIASVIQKRLGKFVEYGVDDELSIGLLAFNEAINTYDINKGKFLSFARLVISNRLIDYFRKQSKFSSALISYDDGEDNTTSGLIDKKSVELFAYDSEAEDRKYEIIEYTRELGQWGISFNELVRICPRQDNLRNEYIRIAILISRDKTLLDELYRTKRLPIKMLEKKLPIHRKKIERGRIYIIALVVAIIKKYSFLDMTTRNI